MRDVTPKVVLLVEDDPTIRLLLADYLESEHYRVIQADSAAQASEVLSGQPRLDLLISDYRLPGGVSGVKIAEPALKLRPDLKVIFISGYPAEIFETGTELCKTFPVLAKPFTPDTLRERIEGLLA